MEDWSIKLISLYSPESPGGMNLQLTLRLIVPEAALSLKTPVDTSNGIVRSAVPSTDTYCARSKCALPTVF